MTISEQALRQALAAIVPDELGTDLVSAGCVTRIAMTDEAVQLEVRLGYPCQSRLADYRQQIGAALEPLLAGAALHLDMG